MPSATLWSATSPRPGITRRTSTSHSVSTSSASSSSSSSSAPITEQHPRPQPRPPGKTLPRPKWLASMKTWLATSEPSARAMRQQKTRVYERLGVDPRTDPRAAAAAAAARLHAPVGSIPAGATTSTAGPSPEKALMAERGGRRSRPCGQRSYAGSNDGGLGEIPGGGSSEGRNPVTPWD
ncbi:hypothetical protein N3K66_001946 [Trichothecium roseum]|uniref:Uncharacterized protein n=1 Tax=Trichothecium roseum TaxID=47278 RepID=A0ACC0V8Q6_9HYPO|nr:hypothetical protein N3K66_001946 [Trichothecium roseum]